MIIARTVFTLSVCFGVGLFSAAAAAQEPTFSLEVTSVNGRPLKKPTDKITVAPGDVLVLKIFIRDWSPDGQKLRALQAQIESRAYTSGSSGSIDPVDYQETTLSEFENKANGFIDTNDPQYVFKGVKEIPVVDTLSFGYRYLNIIISADDAIICPQDGTRFSCGTLNVQVSDDASGIFLLGLDDDPSSSTMQDDHSVAILPLHFEQLTVTVLKDATVLRVLGSDPPAGAIDARQGKGGWDRIDLIFNADTAGVKAGDFTIEDGSLHAPKIRKLEAHGTQLTLWFDRGIQPARWTAINHTSSSTGIRIGCLPGDVNGDGFVDAVDVFLLADQANGRTQLPPYQADVDADGTFGVADALRIIDLLNQPNAYRAALP